MTTKSTQVKTGNINQVNKTIQERLLGGNDFAPDQTYTDSGAGSTLENFLLVGEISASPKNILPCDADTPAVDGTQYPLGLLWLGHDESVTVAASAVKKLTVVIKGRIDETLIKFSGATTLDSVIGGRTVRQLLNDRGFILINPVENTNFSQV